MKRLADYFDHLEQIFEIRQRSNPVVKAALEERKEMKVNDIEVFLNEVFRRKMRSTMIMSDLLQVTGIRLYLQLWYLLDLTSKAIEAAKKSGAKLIVTHHPIIFGGIKTLTMDD